MLALAAWPSRNYSVSGNSLIELALKRKSLIINMLHNSFSFREYEAYTTY